MEDEAIKKNLGHHQNPQSKKRKQDNANSSELVKILETAASSGAHTKNEGKFIEDSYPNTNVQVNSTSVNPITVFDLDDSQRTSMANTSVAVTTVPSVTLPAQPSVEEKEDEKVDQNPAEPKKVTLSGLTLAQPQIDVVVQTVPDTPLRSSEEVKAVVAKKSNFSILIDILSGNDHLPCNACDDPENFEGPQIFDTVRRVLGDILDSIFYHFDALRRD